MIFVLAVLLYIQAPAWKLNPNFVIFAVIAGVIIGMGITAN